MIKKKQKYGCRKLVQIFAPRWATSSSLPTRCLRASCWPKVQVGKSQPETRRKLAVSTVHFRTFADCFKAPILEKKQQCLSVDSFKLQIMVSWFCFFKKGSNMCLYSKHQRKTQQKTKKICGSKQPGPAVCAWNLKSWHVGFWEILAYKI